MCLRLFVHVDVNKFNAFLAIVDGRMSLERSLDEAEDRRRFPPFAENTH